MKAVFLMQSGRYFHYLEPAISVLSIEDIAHGLGNLCRFNGHTRVFYSVAQHSVMASYLVAREHRMAALFHDASEAVMCDIPTPLKRMLPDYLAIEERVEAAILAKLGLPWPMHPSIKTADLIMLASERRDLMPMTPPGWDGSGDAWSIIENVLPLRKRVVPVGPKAAKRMFLRRYAELVAANEAEVAPKRRAGLRLVA